MENRNIFARADSFVFIPETVPPLRPQIHPIDLERIFFLDEKSCPRDIRNFQAIEDNGQAN